MRAGAQMNGFLSNEERPSACKRPLDRTPPIERRFPQLQVATAADDSTDPLLQPLEARIVPHRVPDRVEPKREEVQSALTVPSKLLEVVQGLAPVTYEHGDLGKPLQPCWPCNGIA